MTDAALAPLGSSDGFVGDPRSSSSSSASAPRTAARPIVADSAERAIGLDRMRLLAAALMIQGHTFTVVASPALRAAPGYRWHDFVHGFTAPIFLFGAGLAFGLGLERRLATRGPSARARDLERSLTLLLLSAMLHLGSTTYRGLVALPIETQRQLLAVDALACIGVCLALGSAFVELATDARAVRRYAAVAAAVFVLLAPSFDRRVPGTWPPLVEGFLHHGGGSLFPLFPWAGYAMIGIALAPLARGKGPIHALRVAALGLAAIGLGLGLHGILPDAFGEHAFWLTSPYFFLGRLGVLLVLLALLGLTPALGGLASRLARTLTGETLCLYLVHLALLYGTPLTRSLRGRLGGALDLGGASGLALGLTVVSVFVALAFARTKERHGRAVTVARRVALVAILLRFATAA